MAGNAFDRAVAIWGGKADEKLSRARPFVHIRVLAIYSISTEQIVCEPVWPSGKALGW